VGSPTSAFSQSWRGIRLREVGAASDRKLVDPFLAITAWVRFTPVGPAVAQLIHKDVVPYLLAAIAGYASHRHPKII